MEFARLETAALAHVDDRYYYGANCGKCKHSARLSLV
jgi:bacterioferritin-associated ferredoxin